MREIKIPINSHDFVGEVTIEFPKHSERLRLAAQLNLDSISVKEGTVVAETNEKSDQLLLTAKMFDITFKYVKAVDLKHNKTGREFKTFDDLQYDDFCVPIVAEISSMVLSGVKLGNV